MNNEITFDLIYKYVKYVSSNIILFGDGNVIWYFVFLIRVPINIYPYIRNILLQDVRDLYQQYSFSNAIFNRWKQACTCATIFKLIGKCNSDPLPFYHTISPIFLVFYFVTYSEIKLLQIWQKIYSSVAMVIVLPFVPKGEWNISVFWYWLSWM